ncbi:hypothetical protein E3E11_02865 [Oecophyllibacter saccharovorans]|uniref:hypothetical protein n=1 Tax=Oecophyllibacter saccharovorans TaxID=2558360 RepID=UPI001142EEE0|nr:hypothetical protein [Oecophyllibacter saccharovorans]QDH14980.1 hypothetical protein E3E11_02865 [Oecophyllibacter saccharovorans]
MPSNPETGQVTPNAIRTGLANARQAASMNSQAPTPGLRTASDKAGKAVTKTDGKPGASASLTPHRKSFWTRLNDFLNTETPEQWATGPLYALFPALDEAGQVVFEPYTQFSVPRGSFGPKGHRDPHDPSQASVQAYWFFNYAITDHLTVATYPTWGYSWGGHQKASSVEFQDLPVDFEYRFTDTYAPSLTAYLGFVAPTGHFSNLRNPANGVGAGVWSIHYALEGLMTFPFFKHALNVYFWGEEWQPVSTARLHNVSVYGTDHGFRGHAHVGANGDAGASFEFGITREFLFAIDMYQSWGASTVTRGHQDGVHQYDRTGWSTSFNLAPALEYNWNPNWGVIMGVIVPTMGHNTDAALQPQVAISSVF